MEKPICRKCGVEYEIGTVDPNGACPRCGNLFLQPLERISEETREPIEIMGGDDTRLVCKYCGGANVKAGGEGTTRYYYCISCERATDLIEIIDYKKVEPLQNGERGKKPELNKVARIIDTVLFGNEFQGVDKWEISKALVERLEHLLSQSKKELLEKIRDMEYFTGANGNRTYLIDEDYGIVVGEFVRKELESLTNQKKDI